MDRTLSLRIADFIFGLDETNIPAAIAEKTQTCLLYGYGMGLNGNDTPYAPVARAAAMSMYGAHPAGATMLGDARKTSIAGACLAGSALLHGRAQEDTCGAAHFGTLLIPLLTSLLETRRYPLARLIPAMVAGYEAGGLLEKAYAGQSTPAGFRASAIYGTVAAAAAVGKMLHLDRDRLAAALANAVSFSGGVLQSFSEGTDEWRYQLGVVAAVGWTAAELAAAGSVSASHAFEGKSGFARAFARAECDVEGLARHLGEDWAMLRVTFKAYPVCAFNQTPVIAALALRERLNGGAPAAVRVRMNPYETHYAGMDAAGPFNSISGTLMSIPFCVATTLLYGVPDRKRMATYDDASLNDLIGRTKLISDPSVPTLSCIIEADTAGGGTCVQDQRMTAADLAYDHATVSKIVRRVGNEQGVPQEAFDRLDGFLAALPDTPIDAVLDAFSVGRAAAR
ncbi:MmgE/PrpD family protein [Oleispirillum naphthae]|uniref:MmgE/PrpD family protein n=1 Tax=Oleispirillum naphthae TaxID=2838853 RepID=UPI00308234E2